MTETTYEEYRAAIAAQKQRDREWLEVAEKAHKKSCKSCRSLDFTFTFARTHEEVGVQVSFDGGTTWKGA